MPKFQQNRTEIEAVQYDGTNKDEITRFVGLAAKVMGRTHDLHIQTPVALVKIAAGDWIIKNDDGTFGTLKPSIFKAKFSPVPEPTGQS